MIPQNTYLSLLNRPGTFCWEWKRSRNQTCQNWSVLELSFLTMGRRRSSNPGSDHGRVFVLYQGTIFALPLPSMVYKWAPARLTLRVKPWPNGLASWRKLKTWVYLRLRLAKACMRLRWLAMTCAHLGRDQICTQVKASFSPFRHPTQVNASWVASINLLLANEIQDMSALKWFFLQLACTFEETCSAFGHPCQRKSLREFKLRPLASTCRSVRPGLNVAKD